MMNEEEYEEKILKEAVEMVEEFKNIHGFNNENMIRLLEDVIKNLN